MNYEAALDASLQRLHDELDIPLLYVSHAQDEVARLADHIVLLSDGKGRSSAGEYLIDHLNRYAEITDQPPT